MSSFIKWIEINHKAFEFSFLEIHTVGGSKYFVTIVDPNIKPIFFTMVAKGDKWRIVEAPKVPTWVKDIENELSKAIIENNPF